MKQAIILGIATSFANTSTKFDLAPPHMVILSCGGSFTYDDAGLSIDQQFDIAEFVDDLLC